MISAVLDALEPGNLVAKRLVLPHQFKADGASCKFRLLPLLDRLWDELVELGFEVGAVLVLTLGQIGAEPVPVFEHGERTLDAENNALDWNRRLERNDMAQFLRNALGFGQIGEDEAAQSDEQLHGLCQIMLGRRLPVKDDGEHIASAHTRARTMRRARK